MKQSLFISSVLEIKEKIKLDKDLILKFVNEKFYSSRDNFTTIEQIQKKYDIQIIINENIYISFAMSNKSPWEDRINYKLLDNYFLTECSLIYDNFKILLTIIDKIKLYYKDNMNNDIIIETLENTELIEKKKENNTIKFIFREDITDNEIDLICKKINKYNFINSYTHNNIDIEKFDILKKKYAIEYFYKHYQKKIKNTHYIYQNILQIKVKKTTWKLANILLDDKNTYQHYDVLNEIVL